MNNNEFDNALATRASDDVNTHNDKNWAIEPLIFDSNEGCPVATPILSGLTFKTISDSSLEIISCEKFDKDLDKFLRNEAYKNLTIDISNNVLYTIINSIFESSTLSFNAWWEHNKYKYFPTINGSMCNCVNLFYHLTQDKDNNYCKSLHESIVRFISTTLSFNESGQVVNKDPDINNILSKGIINKNYYIYAENTAINIANLICIMMVDSISNFLFNFVTLPNSSHILDELKESSPALDKFSKETEKGFSNFVHVAIEYILEDSLYDLIKTCIKPTIFDILLNSIDTFYFVYQDLNLATDAIIKQNEK